MDKELKEMIKGLSFNIHKNNERLDRIKHLLEDIIWELSQNK